MSVPSSPSLRRGLTLVELLVAMGITAVVVGIAIPSMRNWMISQRVVSTAGEIVTDLRFGRSDAISNNLPIQVQYMDAGNGCYTIFRGDPDSTEVCQCSKGAGNACQGLPWVELKTYAAPAGGDVTIKGPADKYKLFNGGYFLDAEGTALQLLVSGGGGKELKVLLLPGVSRPTICAPAGSTITGYTPCP